MIKNLIIFLTSIIILVVCINSSDNLFKKIAAQPLSNKTFVLITNTSVYTCSSPSTSNYSNALNNNIIVIVIQTFHGILPIKVE